MRFSVHLLISVIAYVALLATLAARIGLDAISTSPNISSGLLVLTVSYWSSFAAIALLTHTRPRLISQ